MQVYPNYSMNNYPQYPSYLPQQPMQYMDRLSQLQATQQQMQTPQMQGPVQNFTPFIKVVDNLEAVKVADIPMDGNIYYFPKADGTEIFAKQWLSNGTTQILSFKPVFNDDNNLIDENNKMQLQLTNELFETINARFDDLTDRLDKIEKNIKPFTSKIKKETGTDE